ncbi:MAG TPA: LysE family translocator [Afifellaceae bacterium]|nr:LysE family translocator [Afifellaceae bacterium]
MIEFVPLILGIFLAQASPGPNMMAVSSIALGSGRRAGMLTAAGVATGVFVWAILFAFGVGAFLNAFPQTITAMKLIGGGYLLYLGLKALRTAFSGEANVGSAAAARKTGAQAYGTGLLVVLTNPKAALMWVAVSMFLASAHSSSMQYLIVGVCVSLSAGAIYGVYAFLFSTGIALRAYGRVFRFVEAGFGMVFGAIGAKLVADGIRELRT